jgi:hypothetical protein
MCLLALLCLVLLASTGRTLAQQAPPEPTVQATCPHTLKSSVPFAWLRFDPSSFARFGVTVWPGETVQLNDPPILAWDNTQWWVYVWPNASNTHSYYWVELGSLEPRCQPPPPPTPTPTSGMASWHPGDLVRVRLNVPFVWFRSAPSPGAFPIYIVGPGAQLAIVQGAITDSYNQWWWSLRDPRNGVTGWVEQHLVDLVTTPSAPVAPADWRAGDLVRVRASLPFSWLRFTPSSSGGIAFTARPLQELIVQQGQQFDGVQNWRNVAVPNRFASGWVEEGSLEFVRRGW